MSIQPEVLSALFEMSRDAVLGIDSDQRIAFANPVAATLLGVHPGLDAKDLLPDYILESTSNHFLSTVTVGTQQANVSVVRTDSFMIVTYTLPQPESAAMNPISNRAIQEMSTTLMSMRLAMDALIGHTKAEVDPALRDTACVLYRDHYRMKRLAQHMSIAVNLLQDTLPFSPRLTDLRELCSELYSSVEGFAKDMNIKVSFHADNGRYLTMADPTLLEMMLFNLITNCLNHPGEGRQIDLSLKRQRDRFIITIEDKGTGIASEKMANIFSHRPLLDLSDPNTGTGLGLFIARGIAARHGGALIMAVQNDPGTTVSISLPYTPSDTTEANTPIMRYRADGMNLALTELSVVLDKKYYNRKLFD